MADVPDEIMAKAREVADQVRRGMDRQARIEIIARALMERDQRAADIAKARVVGGYLHGSPVFVDGDEIATAILTYGAKP